MRHRTLQKYADYWLPKLLAMFVAVAWQGISGSHAAVTDCTPTAGFTACKRITYSGGDQTFTVPTGITSLDVRLWGAAGGGANLSFYQLQGGGAGGGYARGTFAVTAGQTLTLVVGQGGIPNSTATTVGGGGQGGGSTDAARIGGSGGGMSAVFVSATKTVANVRLVAGGGGGASPGADGSTNTGSGGGGATTGGQDGQPARSGRGGTQAAGGAAATGTSACTVAQTAGSQFQGGRGATSNGASSNEGGGGGGGGYFGGGGGLCQNSATQNGAGGGGSSYIAGAGVTAGATAAGANFLNSGANCADTAASGDSGGETDALYTTGIGKGTCYGVGGNGEIVIQYLITTITISKISNGGVGTFNFSGGNGFGTDAITTVTAGVAQAGTTKYLANANTATTIQETIPPTYKITAITCSGTSAANYTTNLTTGEVAFTAAAVLPANALACTYTNELLVPGLTLLKTANTPGPVAVGNTITYTFRVTNSGNTTITSVVINEPPANFNGYGTLPVPGTESLLTDTLPAGDSNTGTPNDGTWATLGPGDIITFTATYTVVQGDIDFLQ